MTYWGLNAIFLSVVVVVALGAIVLRRPVSWRAVGIGGMILVVMTAVFDNVMIGIGLVGYNESLISGAFIGIAPLEDFAYAIAGAVLLPSLWALLRSLPPRRAQQSFRGEGEGPAPSPRGGSVRQQSQSPRRSSKSQQQPGNAV